MKTSYKKFTELWDHRNRSARPLPGPGRRLPEKALGLELGETPVQVTLVSPPRGGAPSFSAALFPSQLTHYTVWADSLPSAPNKDISPAGLPSPPPSPFSRSWDIATSLQTWWFLHRKMRPLLCLYCPLQVPLCSSASIDNKTSFLCFHL